MSNSKEDKTPKITDFTVKTPDTTVLKRTSSEISPAEKHTVPKKPNIEDTTTELKNDSSHTVTRTDLQQLLEPLVCELKSLQESFNQTNGKLDSNYDKLEKAITKQKEEFSTELQSLKHTFDNHKDEIAEKVKLTFEKNDSHIQSYKKKTNH